MIHSESESARRGRAVRQAVLVGMFSGTAVGLGFLMAGVPNTELITLTSVLAGGVLGGRLGFVCGALGELIYSLASPYGVPVPQLLVAQTLAMGTAGLVGGLTARGLLRDLTRGRRRRGCIGALVMGLAVTLFFDLLTNLGIILGYGMDARLIAVQAVPFTGLHLATNAPLFLALYPLLLPRLRGLARASLRGRTVAPAVALGMLVLAGAGDLCAQEAAVDTIAAAGTDTLAAAPPDSLGAMVESAMTAEVSARAGASADGGAWSPFTANYVEEMARHSEMLPVVDGAFGSRCVLVGEVTTSPLPLVTRDGIPLGTGHSWSADPWTTSITGQRDDAGRSVAYGADGFGGSDGVVRLRSAPAVGGEAVTDARFRKGSHESYLRSFAIRTPLAPWQVRFDFEEGMDQEGHEFGVPNDTRYDEWREVWGESRFRSARGGLTRALPNGRVAVSFESIRKHKTDLPAVDLDHEEIWGRQAALDWNGRAGGGRLRCVYHWADFDIEQRDDDWRKLESGSEGLLVDWSRGTFDLGASTRWWRLADDGADSSWAGDAGGAVAGDGGESTVSAAWRSTGVLSGRITVAGHHAEGLGWRPEAEAVLGGEPAGLWNLSILYGGRAPRSDELLTVEKRAVPGARVVLLPNALLEAERTVRARIELKQRVLGLDLAGSLTRRWLSDGIGVGAVAVDDDRLRLDNGLEIDSSVATFTASWEGRLWGRLRIDGSASWRDHDVAAGQPLILPPEESWRVATFWRHVFFEGDGIVELGHIVDCRGAMPDPWAVDAELLLPARTRHDLFFGFRLIDADLVIEMRNFTDDKFQESAGSLAAGREVFYRLEWRLLH